MEEEISAIRAVAEAPPVAPHVSECATGVAEDIAGHKTTSLSLPTGSTGHGRCRMTPASLRQLCDERDMYTTPEVNTVLFLGNVGWEKIEALEPFRALQTLHLQSNGLRSIEGLSALAPTLENLNLSQNLIADVGDGVAALYRLKSLNLSNNILSSLHGIQPLRALEILDTSRNELSDYEGIVAVLHCPSLVDLSLEHNALPDFEATLSLVRQLPELQVLRMSGNPLVRTVRQYKKRVVLACTRLTFLDDAPVFPDDRRRAKAWERGMQADSGAEDYAAGAEAERAELRAIGLEKGQAARLNHEWMASLRGTGAAGGGVESTTETHAKADANADADDDTGTDLDGAARTVDAELPRQEVELLSAKTKRLLRDAGCPTSDADSRSLDLSGYDHTNFNFRDQRPLDEQRARFAPASRATPGHSRAGSVTGAAAAPAAASVSEFTDFEELD